MDRVALLKMASTSAARKARKHKVDLVDIYFIECEGFVKIGHATNAADRLSKLRAACPFPMRLLMVLSGRREDEKTYHRRFRDHHHRGEWFRHEGGLAEFILQRSQENHRTACSLPPDYDGQLYEALAEMERRQSG